MFGKYHHSRIYDIFKLFCLTVIKSRVTHPKNMSAPAVSKVFSAVHRFLTRNYVKRAGHSARNARHFCSSEPGGNLKLYIRLTLFLMRINVEMHSIHSSWVRHVAMTLNESNDDRLTVEVSTFQVALQVHQLSQPGRVIFFLRWFRCHSPGVGAGQM